MEEPSQYFEAMAAFQALIILDKIGYIWIRAFNNQEDFRQLVIIILHQAANLIFYKTL